MARYSLLLVFNFTQQVVFRAVALRVTTSSASLFQEQRIAIAVVWHEHPTAHLMIRWMLAMLAASKPPPPPPFPHDNSLPSSPLWVIPAALVPTPFIPHLHASTPPRLHNGTGRRIGCGCGWRFGWRSSSASTSTRGQGELYDAWYMSCGVDHDGISKASARHQHDHWERCVRKRSRSHSYFTMRAIRCLWCHDHQHSMIVSLSGEL